MRVTPDFPEHRREDPRRRAELAVYNEFLNSTRAGHVLYELKRDRNAVELDFAAIIQDVAHFGIQVKGGRYTIENGSWFLETDEGLVATPSPLAQTWDAAIQIRDVLRKELGRKVFIVGVLVFPDMELDPDIETWAAGNRVRILWGSHNLVERLVALVEDEEIFSPPTLQQIRQEVAVLRPGLAIGDTVEMDANAAEAPDVAGQSLAISHADVVNVHHYHGTVNIYNGPGRSDEGQLPRLAANG